MKWRACITNILRNMEGFKELIDDCNKVKDAKYIYGEFDDEDTAEMVCEINKLLNRMD